MLETSKERVKLLKAGIIGKKIEELYISANHIKILKHPVLFDSEAGCTLKVRQQDNKSDT
jgi:hypothetical protein